MDGSGRDKIINSNISQITKTANEGNNYSASVRPFYMAKQFFLFVNETFRDIRLVGAPPSSIGKFGGETDNWIWPRHTGDFSLFRIYAGKDNKPADYSRDNVPYKPAYHFPISMKGIKEGDFTMVFGYPGSTSEYVPSYHIDMVKNYINPKMIDIRTKKIDIMEAAMNTDPFIRIQYSGKKTGIANSWKKWIGENQGLNRMATIEKKREFESRLTSWINKDSNRVKKYGHILPMYKDLYNGLKVYNLVNSYTNEIFFNNGAEAVGFARNIKSLADLIKSNADEDQIKVMKINLLETSKSFFQNYNADTDKKLFVAVMTLYGENLNPEWLAPEYINMKNSCNGNFLSVVDKLFGKTIFSDESRFRTFVLEFNKAGIKKLSKDPFYKH
jgi:hypothetical protein